LVKSERRRRSTVIDESRIGYERSFLSRGWVPILLLILSVAMTFYTDLFANRKAMGLLQISQLPYVRYLPGGGSIFLPEVKAGEVWRLITPIFVHGSVMHIVFNMMWLVQLGRFIESRFGAAKLLALVMAIGVGSNLAEYLWKSPHFGGMSGVIYGLFGFLWMKGKFDRSQNWQLPTQTVQLMLMWMVLCYTDMLGPVANAAHTVGLLIGMLLGITSARLVPFLEREAR
jgi:GlpG protein